MRPFGLGPWELIIILGIVLLLFGPKQIPKLSRMFGKAMKDVKDGLDGKVEEDEKAEPTPIAETKAPGEAEAEATKSEEVKS